MKALLKKLLPGKIKNRLTTSKALKNRLLTLEEGRHNRRFAAGFDMADYLVGAQIQGDYCEFGVYRGGIFSYAYRLLAPRFPAMRFFAFDSFAGLPKPHDVDAANGFSSNFHEHEFVCGEEDFLANLKQNHLDMARVRTIKGWFKETLAAGNAEEYGIKKIAVAWIDCDLYESTVPVLNFILPHLSVGSVVVFDDWRCFRNLPEFGEQRACREWLAANPHLTLNQLFSYGFHGIAFTVGSL